MSDEPALLDTNVLVYALFIESPHHATSRALITRAGKGDANLAIAAQALAEFYSIVTNSKRVTAPRKSEEAILAIEAYLALPGLRLLPQPSDLVTRWCELVRQHPVTGADVFDVPLIATMLGSGIRRICTFNSTPPTSAHLLKSKCSPHNST